MKNPASSQPSLTACVAPASGFIRGTGTFGLANFKCFSSSRFSAFRGLGHVLSLDGGSPDLGWLAPAFLVRGPGWNRLLAGVHWLRFVPRLPDVPRCTDDALRRTSWLRSTSLRSATHEHTLRPRSVVNACISRCRRARCAGRRRIAGAGKASKASKLSAACAQTTDIRSSTPARRINCCNSSNVLPSVIGTASGSSSLCCNSNSIWAADMYDPFDASRSGLNLSCSTR
mmetsp:Transcript_150833/g.262753  ORF Transcript_150833/g.262753 Transcript_150833/m.262753 type:complete len:229 (-) Transcript_150833:885-1571(-)